LFTLTRVSRDIHPGFRPRHSHGGDLWISRSPLSGQHHLSQITPHTCHSRRPRVMDAKDVVGLTLRGRGCQDLVASSHHRINSRACWEHQARNWGLDPWDCRLMTAKAENGRRNLQIAPNSVSVGCPWEATLTIISSRLKIHQHSRHHVGIEERSSWLFAS
jgi:hypothetical protein